jgi:hypothetical protein
MTDIPDATLSEALCAACEASGGTCSGRRPRASSTASTGLDLFTRDLSRRGLLSSEAMAAVKERREQLGRGRG